MSDIVNCQSLKECEKLFLEKYRVLVFGDVLHQNNYT